MLHHSLNQRMPNNYQKCLLLKFVLLFIIFGNFATTSPSPEKTCRDHYLNGHFMSAVLPLRETKTSDSTVFQIECKFPQYSSQSYDTITTVIHNGLEQWLSLNSTTEKTVNYQISDWLYLRTIVDEADDCFQDLLIRWGDPSINAFNHSLLHIDSSPEFTIQSLSGKKKVFREYSNTSLNQRLQTVQLRSKNAGILHIFPSSFSSSVSIKTSPLRCNQVVVPNNAEYIFDLVTVAETLWINVNSASNTIEHELKTLSFSFRTDRPTQPFFNIRTNLGDSIRVDLIDGYLITVNHIIHPIGLITDGNWHRATINLKTLALQIDSDEETTSISLYSRGTTALHNQPDDYSIVKLMDLTILLTNAQITAIRFHPPIQQELFSNLNSEKSTVENIQGNTQWLCSNSPFIKLNSGTKTPNHQFNQQICSAHETLSSFCNCFGPNSALLPHVGRYPASCAIEDGSKALRLHRASDRLTFIYVPNFRPKSSISIVFRSDLDNGLLAFGTWTTMTQYASPFAPTEQATRIQVHFVGRIMSVVLCSRLTDGSERCYFCSIDRPQGYSTGEWIRMSLFSHEVYYFMTVNEQICHLSPNSLVPDTSELYKVSNAVKNVLLVGGMYYTKNVQLNRKINDTMRQNFHDNTREKPLSFQGCIAEVRISGLVENLRKLLDEQYLLFAKNHELPPTIFGVKEFGCQTSCDLPCGKAPCKSKYILNTANEIETEEFSCDCAVRYFLHHPQNEKICIGDESEIENNQPSNPEILLSSINYMELSMVNLLRPTMDESITNNRILFDYSLHKILNKIWLLFRLPTTNEELHTLMELGPILIRVGSNGKRLIVEIEEYEVKEEFFLSQLAEDKRLHLLAIELNPSIGTAIEGKSISIRLDSEIRSIYGVSQIPFHPIRDQWRIIPVITEEENLSPVLDIAKTGCLAEFSLSFLPFDEVNRHYQQRLNHLNMEQNFLDLIVQGISRKMQDDDQQEFRAVLMDGPCGIRDSQLWFENSSSWGVVGEYDPNGTFSNYNGSTTTLISLFMTFLLILIVLIFICCYCYLRFRNEREEINHGRNINYKRNITKSTIGGKFDQFSVGSTDEKRPLKSENFNMESSGTSSMTRSPTQKIDIVDGLSKQTTENSNINEPSIQTPTPTETNYVILRNNTQSIYSPSNSFIIDEYSSSPKLAGRRHRSKAAILLRRPPDPPQPPLKITSNNTAVGMELLNNNNIIISPSSHSSGSIAPIAIQEEIE